MSADPIAATGGHFQRKVDIAGGVGSTINPFRDPQLRIEEQNNVRVREFLSGPADLNADGIEQCVDFDLRTASD